MAYDFFTDSELMCKCGCGQVRMDLDFMDWLIILRTEFNRPMPLSSAYRCPRHNAKVSSTGATGPHTTGKAVDVRIYGKQALRLVTLALQRGATGIGIKQKGPHDQRFIHIDTLVTPPRPWIWSY